MTESPTKVDEQYIARVAYYLGFTMETLPADVRRRIEHRGERGFSVMEAYYSIRDALVGL
jgi:hypothetical protein